MEQGVRLGAASGAMGLWFGQNRFGMDPSCFCFPFFSGAPILEPPFFWGDGDVHGGYDLGFDPWPNWCVVVVGTPFTCLLIVVYIVVEIPT